MDTSQMTCPKCGWAREPGAVDCPACGIVYARYTAAPNRPSPAGTAAFAPPPPSTEALNPYAPPQSNLQSAVETPQGMFGMVNGTGVWRTGDLLVMQKGANLPNRCLVCNQPASVQFPKKMYWHSPWIYLLLIPSILIYAIVAMIARKKADVVLPLCTEHSDKRKRATTIGSLLIVFGLVAMFGSCTQAGEGSGDTFAMILGIGTLVLFVGLIVLAVGSNLIVPKKIDDYYVWLRKVSASYLATLPPAPPGL